MPSEMHAIGQQYATFQHKGFSNSKAPLCDCLSTMYLAASNPETTANKGFPVALVPIRAALHTARSFLVCERCPQKLASGRQNVSLLISLLGSIASGIRTLLADVDAETERARAAGETKLLDTGDASATNAHLHTGTPDCPGRMALELEAEEWQIIVRRAVKKHAFKQKSDILSLEALIDGLEERQRAWHRGAQPCTETDHMTEAVKSLDEKEWACLKFTQGIRYMLEQIT